MIFWVSAIPTARFHLSQTDSVSNNRQWTQQYPASKLREITHSSRTYFLNPLPSGIPLGRPPLQCNPAPPTVTITARIWPEWYSLLPSIRQSSHQATAIRCFRLILSSVMEFSRMPKCHSGRLLWQIRQHLSHQSRLPLARASRVPSNLSLRGCSTTMTWNFDIDIVLCLKHGFSNVIEEVVTSNIQ